MTLLASIDQKMFASPVGGPKMGRFRQRASETITFSVSYDLWLDRSDSIAAILPFSVAVIADASLGVDTPPAITAQTINGREILFQLSGGFDGSKYEITTSIQTTSGEIKIDFFHVTIGSLSTQEATLTATQDAIQALDALNALINAWVSSRPVWDGVSALPVSSGQWFINNGKLEQAQ